MQRGLFFDAVICKGCAIVQNLVCIKKVTFRQQGAPHYLGLHRRNGINTLHQDGGRFTAQHLHKYLHHVRRSLDVLQFKINTVL